ncbi:DUF2515 domain-containing protein [Filobacillus milosensis]|uniref:DUF2515 domain-containing protein n=1 Tax=Filobacillus milosensis TaxID=94137 RepID=A0A4Y8IT80_9BACI|nr:DUF2515 family protein [Filobacillus milosensis]TFB23997.1 DUF2515 domain-containing protein [Filobacillus milosensis]
MIPLIVDYIKEQTKIHNQNNVTRSKAYLNFYEKHPEIKWSFLASMVSRNAGWNMTDLQTEPYVQFLSEDRRKSLYLTYESINWYIFQDAYPQLLIYQLSMEKNTPLFFLLKHFYVSSFIEQEWYRFYREKNKERLLYAQIINEQNIIELPIMEHQPYKNKIFRSLTFQTQNIVDYNAVLLPTENGQLYGEFVSHFLNVSRRIAIGKKIANILFYPYLYPRFLSFARRVAISGSRKEYEQFTEEKLIHSNPLKDFYRNTQHHMTDYKGDWSSYTKIKKKWWKEENIEQIVPINSEFYQKRKWLKQLSTIKSSIKHESVEKS